MVLSKYGVQRASCIYKVAKGMAFNMQRSFLPKSRFIDKILGTFFGVSSVASRSAPHQYLLRVVLAASTMFCLLMGDVGLSEEWNVGLRVAQFSDPVMQSKIDVAIWYPTHASIKEESVGMAILQVAKDAYPLTESKGLILISHGFSGNFLGHHDTAQFLSKSGYVVATFTHPDLPGLTAGSPEFDPLIIRPRQIQLVIDGLSNLPLFKDSLLGKRIGIVGFSLGAYTALISAGAKPDLSSLEGYCATEPRDFLLCSVKARQRFASIGPQLALLSGNQISGIVLLAPAYGPLFSAKSFANVSIPMRMFSAEKDEELDNRFHAQHLKNLLSDNATLEVIADAGHYIFMAPCPDRLKLAVPVICEDPESIDRAEIHKRLNKDIAIFFGEVLDFGLESEPQLHSQN